jgi:hypothetical protein
MKDMRENGETVVGSIDMMIFDKELQKRLMWKEDKWFDNKDDTN